MAVEVACMMQKGPARVLRASCERPASVLQEKLFAFRVMTCDGGPIMGVPDFLKRKSVRKTENAVPREWIVEGDPYWLPQTIGEWRRDEITRYKPLLGWSVSYDLTDDPVLATIYFYDGGLDDRLFEVVKLIMQGGAQSLNLDENAPIFYGGAGIGASGKRQVHLLSFREGNQVEISLKPAAYEKLQSDFAGAIPVDEGTLGQWLEIDSHYAWNLCSPGRKFEQAKGGRYRVNATRV